ncbi:MAG: CHC2 zinc finger domain-containing protein [Pirellulaceae bacterium]
MNIKQAKAIPLEDVLQRLGHTPERRGQNQLWYLSPFRIETTPSFKVDPDANSFWDFGEGKGGDALDLIQRIEGLPKVADALARLERLFGNGPLLHVLLLQRNHHQHRRLRNLSAHSRYMPARYVPT